ncbi:flagellar biosynthesis protein FlhF [Sulfurovum lithotrophicum]|uniref:Flagellar biosynthesis protein FlhF n=1 Tax=Sulfurovum lithotrophicum TaxID=206403 RepID=A0A7U4M0I5_9BACT|nr:flagellar biosynthesis protein FlhF [Sulfurovum lithotrophicum]AKF24640.1 flagellar biosynthesis protein FlhF [Sulfurovum lithotrophicum]
MINETFVAADPKSAYEQAVDKYGTDIKIVSAKQVKYDDDELRSEVVIAVPKALFMEKSFGTQALYTGPENEEETLLDEIGELKTQLEEMHNGLLQKGRFGTVADDVKKLFMQKGIAEQWLDSILIPLIGTTVMDDAQLLVSYLLEEIDETLKVKEEDLDHSKIMMLVGPTGVGKTTTIAKLAARYAYLLDRPYKVALINLDSYKVGAIEQLAHYADIMQIEHYSIASADAFGEKIEALSSYDIILVDTAGMSPYDTQKFVKTIEFVNTKIPKKIEVALVLAATVKYEDMEDIHENFSFLNLDSVIISKFDETKHFGTLLNFMLLYDLPMSYFSTGQEVPDDLLVASKEYLLEKFIGDVHEG